MRVRAAVLYAGDDPGSSTATRNIYAPSQGDREVVIDKFTIHNTRSTDIVVTMQIGELFFGATDFYLYADIIKDRTVPAGGTWNVKQMRGQVLGYGNYNHDEPANNLRIRVTDANLPGVVVRVSGRIFT